MIDIIYNCNMNIQQLEYIIAVDKLKNFTRAAEQCFVTQATLSTMIKKLEDELGVIIFDRKANPILTTDIGRNIIAEAELIIKHSQRIADMANQQKDVVKGQIRIGIIPTIANSFLPKVLKPLVENFPELEIELVELTTANSIEQLKNGKIDAAIISTPINIDDIQENILYYEALMVYGEVATNKKYVLPEDVNNNKIWLLEEGHCLREQFIKICSLKQKDSLPNSVNFEANSLETLINLADEFGGLTIIPELYYQTLGAERKKKVLPFKKPLPVREISMVYYRPYSKLFTINKLSEFISSYIAPFISTTALKSKDMEIAKLKVR
jgi:LysR family hydrogen peroxide-inducible transcriptional activator